MNILVNKKVRNKIDKIFEHPNDIYSVYMKNGDVEWVDGKVELYEFLRKLCNCDA